MRHSSTAFITVAAAMAAVVALLLASPASATYSATFVRTDVAARQVRVVSTVSDTANATVAQTTPPGTKASKAPAAAFGTPKVTWHQHQATAIFDTVSLSRSAGAGVATTGTAPPVEAVVTALNPSSATPSVIAAAASTKDVILAQTSLDSHIMATVVVALNAATNATYVTLSKYTASDVAATTKPDWSVTTQHASFADGGLAVSADGKHIVFAIVDTSTATQQTSIQVFSPESSKVLSSVALPAGVVGCCMSSITSTGRILVVSTKTVYVVDVVAGQLVQSLDRGYFNAAVAIADDGNYIAYGFLSLTILKWDAATAAYAPIYSQSTNGFIPCSFAFSPDSTTVAVGMYNETTARQNVVQLWSLAGDDDAVATAPTVKWTYKYPNVYDQPLQDTVSGIQFTADGSHIALGSWGCDNATNPTVRVIAAASGTLEGSFVTPGSVFGIGVMNSAGEGSMLQVTALGKAVHANKYGNGGDWYSLAFDL